LDRMVLDNSVMVRAFLPDENGHDSAAKVLALLSVGDIVALAPRNMMYEFCNAMAKAFRKRRRPCRDAVESLHKFLNLPIQYVDWEGMLERTMELSFSYGKSWYDMCYLAVGEHENVRVCTEDRSSVASLPDGLKSRFVFLDDFFRGA